MHMHATPCDGTFQKALIRKLYFGAQCWQMAGLREDSAVTQLHTDSIFVRNRFYRMSLETEATEVGVTVAGEQLSKDFHNYSNALQHPLPQRQRLCQRGIVTRSHAIR